MSSTPLLDAVRSNLHSEKTYIKHGVSYPLQLSTVDPSWASERYKAYMFAVKTLLTNGELDISLVKDYCLSHRYTVQKNEMYWIKRMFDGFTPEQATCFDWSPFDSLSSLRLFTKQMADDNQTWFMLRQDNRDFCPTELASYETRPNLIAAATSWLTSDYIRSLLYDLDDLDGTSRGHQVLKTRRIALIVCLNLLNGPCRRLEYFDLQFQRDADCASPQNYFVDADTSSNNPCIILEHYKTSSLYGTFTKFVVDYVTLYLLRTIPTSKTWAAEPLRLQHQYHYFSPQHKSRQMMDAFSTILQGRHPNPDPRISCNLLRKIDVLYYSDIGALLLPEGRRWLCVQHGNNPRTQLTCYVKNKPVSEPGDLCDESLFVADADSSTMDGDVTLSPELELGLAPEADVSQLPHLDTPNNEALLLSHPKKLCDSRKDKAIAALKSLGSTWSGVRGKWPQIFALNYHFHGEPIGPLIRSLVPDVHLPASNIFKKFQERINRYEEWSGEKATIRNAKLQQSRDKVYKNKKCKRDLDNLSDENTSQ